MVVRQVVAFTTIRRRGWRRPLRSAKPPEPPPLARVAR